MLFDKCKPATLDPEGKELIGRLVFAKIRDLGVTGIGGLELDLVPVSLAVSLISQLEGKPISRPQSITESLSGFLPSFLHLLDTSLFC